MHKNTRLSIYLLIFTVIVFLSVFLLPFYIPRKIPAVSPSYDYGFNNTIAVIALCLSLFIGTIAFYKPFCKKVQFLQIGGLFTKKNDAGLSIKFVLIILFVHFFAILGLYLLNANYGYGEGNYFLVRIDRLALGQKPYKDFEYAYGLLMIYLPKLITDVFKFSTSVPGYYISLTILEAIGILFLHYVINSFNVPAKNKKVIFLIIGLSCIPLSLGMNYILIRFITPIASLLALKEIVGKLENGSLKNCFFFAIATVTISVLNFLTSMEVGIAVLLSIAGYLFFSVVINKKTYHIVTLLAAAILITALILLMGKSFGITITAFAAGGNNWVVIPSPSIVLFLISFLVVNFIFCTWLLTKNVSFLTCTLLIFNIIMLVGAFGRCDPGHIYWYGLSSLITMWMLTAYTNTRNFKIYTIAFILIFGIGMFASGLFLYKTELSTLVARYFISKGKVKSLDEFAEHVHYDTAIINRYADRLNEKIDFEGISKYNKIALPFDVDPAIYLYLLKNNIYAPEYYTGYFSNTFTPYQINAKLKALQDSNHKYMIVPEAVYNFNYTSDIAAEKRFISISFLYPYNYTKKRDSQKMYAPVYTYIHDKFRPLEVVKNGFLLVERIN